MSVPPIGAVTHVTHVTHVHSSQPRIAVAVFDPTEQMAALPSDVPSPPSSKISVNDTVATPALTSEAFLGNPRAY